MLINYKIYSKEKKNSESLNALHLLGKGLKKLNIGWIALLKNKIYLLYFLKDFSRHFKIINWLKDKINLFKIEKFFIYN